MATGKITKDYTCPYCGRSYVDDRWAPDHIIPRDIGGPKRFKLISCSQCNGRIGREVEQPALRSGKILDSYCSRIEEGFPINTRRKRKGLVPVPKHYGVSCGRKVRFYRDLENGERHLVFLDGAPSSIPEHGVAIIPDDTFEDDGPFLRLVNKIALGTMFWLWGDAIQGHKGIVDLRTRMWNRPEESKVIRLNEDESHLALTDRDGSSERVSRDAMDNRPHHSICIFRDGDIVFSLVNLFGELESMDFLVDPELAGHLKKEDGEVVIARTTENSVVRLSLDDYMKYKTAILGRPVSMRCEVPFGRDDLTMK
jgi:hypothetical protein